MPIHQQLTVTTFGREEIQKAVSDAAALLGHTVGPTTTVALNVSIDEHGTAVDMDAVVKTETSQAEQPATSDPAPSAASPGITSTPV